MLRLVWDLPVGGTARSPEPDVEVEVVRIPWFPIDEVKHPTIASVVGGVFPHVSQLVGVKHPTIAPVVVAVFPHV